MKAVIKHNGRVIPEALCIVDTSNNTVILETMVSPSMKIDLNREKGFVEVNLFAVFDEIDNYKED